KINNFNLDNTFFKDEANFLDIKNKDNDKLESKNIANRETARIIKHSFEKIGNIIEANKFYALEMEKQEKELKWSDNFAEKLVFTFHKLSSNHSQDWVLTLFWIMNMTLVKVFLEFEYCEEISLYYNIPISFIVIISIFIVGLFILELDSKYKLLFDFSFTSLFIYIYASITPDTTLCYISNSINPFSIMTTQSLSFSELIYKIIIAYLIYQFIISIRQNTRRK
ncbi:MAG: hypothetical protein U9N59_00445, partial [Campylobacterota bacterium]|nr:hypothetical protein [Campylobacterota bacterium]